jgi:hypothetical protein
MAAGLMREVFHRANAKASRLAGIPVPWLETAPSYFSTPCHPRQLYLVVITVFAIGINSCQPSTPLTARKAITTKRTTMIIIIPKLGPIVISGYPFFFVKRKNGFELIVNPFTKKVLEKGGGLMVRWGGL